MLSDPHPECRARNPLGRSKVRWQKAALVVVTMLASHWLGIQMLRAQTVVDRRSEYNVKAVYLYSFGRYVAWPENAFTSKDAPLVIGVLGDNPFDEALERIAKTKLVHGRPIRIRRYTAGDDCSGCHILFISQETTLKTQEQVFAQLRNRPVLMVGEQPGFARRGGMVSFFIPDKTVRFRINVTTAQSHGLSIGGKLLSLAQIVDDAMAERS